MKFFIDSSDVEEIKKAASYATRQYRVERVRIPRIIKPTEMDEVMRFYARTYYGATIANIEANYKKFRPKPLR